MLGGLFNKIKQGIQKTKEKITGGIQSVLSTFRKIDEDAINQIEEILISADVGVAATDRICGKLREKMKKGDLKSADDAMFWIKTEIKEILNSAKPDSAAPIPHPPFLIMFVGVNGSGKTTSIAKMANFLKNQGKSVMLCAGDTFRAAAVEQLSIWADRLKVPIVKGQIGSDPAAVVYDACESAVNKKADYLLIDTAGRLQNKENLMKELEKVTRVIGKKIPRGPHEVLLVLDATVGQNALSQAASFKQMSNVSGIFLSKLDGSAKGGIIIAIAQEHRIPVKYIGTGERVEDMAEFSADSFVDALFE